MSSLYTRSTNKLSLVWCIAGLLLAFQNGFYSSALAEEGRSASVNSQSSEKEALAVLDAHGGAMAFTPLYREAVSTFFQADDAYKRREYSTAEKLINGLFFRHPEGSAEWTAAMKGVDTTGLNFGRPPCYYALRMLQDCSVWKETRRFDFYPGYGRAAELRWTVVLVKHFESRQPRNMAEWRSGSGPVRRFELNSQLTEAVVLEASDLFRRYIEAISQGTLKVVVKFQQVDEPVKGVFKNFPEKHIGIGNVDQLLNAVPDKIRRETDWWWVIYPSTVPDGFPDFKKQEFVSGGTHYPSQGGPCFVADDLWLLRKPPHLGFGVMTATERRAYLSQWLQHEFFHYLFKTYPEYKLEGAKGHEWFDRSTWPEDFVGQFEPDYYYEALHKRILLSKRPLCETLVRHMPDLGFTDLSGTYVRKPVENDWHRGVLKAETIDGKSLYRWTNNAGVGWNLYQEPGSCNLSTDKNCPYFNEPAGKEFCFKAHSEKFPRMQIDGFYFNGEFYEREK